MGYFKDVTPESVGISSKGIMKFLDRMEQNQIELHSFMVLRHGQNLTGNVRDFLEEFQNTDRYKIMLCHRPDSFVFGDASDYWKIDLVISGHDHGGQVVIPFKGGLYGGDQGWFPPYVHGLYRTGRIRLFVTSGLSSEKQKLPRWNNRPEIAVLNVH